MNNYTINTRLANEYDAQAIAKIHVASWQKIYRGHIPEKILDNLSVQRREEKWHELINNNVTILVIEKNNNLVGFASLCAARDEGTDPTICGEISAIYLNPKVWRQKLGKRLCLAALNKLEKMGFSKCIVWVLVANNQARRFYEAMGFTNTGKSKTATLNACTLGVVSGEEATEQSEVTLFEVCYLKSHLI